MAIISFRDKISEDICYARLSKAAHKRLPGELHSKARAKLAILAAATSLNDLGELRGNRLELLKGDRAGAYSIRINDQFRVCFHWSNGNALDVEITDYH